MHRNMNPGIFALIVGIAMSALAPVAVFGAAAAASTFDRWYLARPAIQQMLVDQRKQGKLEGLRALREVVCPK